MLNYIWASMVAVSLAFALTADMGDLRHDTYRNGKAMPVAVVFSKPYVSTANQQDVQVKIDPAAYSQMYATGAKPAQSYSGVLMTSAAGQMLRFGKGAELPDRLATIRDLTSADAGELRGTVSNLAFTTDPLVATAGVTFEKVKFVKLQAITSAAIDMAKKAVEICIGLIGALALWLGIVKIAEKAGLLYVVVKVTQPVLRVLFPEVPKGHPALGMIALNLTANMLGLANAATPFGLKAMEELQKLNPKKDTATNSMVMMLALHATAFQLTPPLILYAIMGLQANLVYFPILIVTFASTVVAALGAFGLGWLPWYRRTDPYRLATAEELEEVANNG